MNKEQEKAKAQGPKESSKGLLWYLPQTEMQFSGAQMADEKVKKGQKQGEDGRK